MKKLILLYFVAWCVLFSLDAKPRTIKYKDGSIYVGDVIKRNPNGEGEMTYPDGTTLKGYWENGSCIRGTQELSNGDIFEGSFKNGVWDNGTLTENKTKNVYQGSFIHNRLNGQGKLVCADGKSYEGLWEDGSIKSGVMYNQGLVFEGTFVSFKPRTGKIDGVYKNKHRLHGEIIEGEVASGSYEYLLDSTKINFENARTCYGTIDLPEKRMKIRGWFKPTMRQRYIFSDFSFINGKEVEIDCSTDKFKYKIIGVCEEDSLVNPKRFVQENLQTGKQVNLDVNVLEYTNLDNIFQHINLTEAKKYEFHDYDVYVSGRKSMFYEEVSYEYIVKDGEKLKHGKFNCKKGCESLLFFGKNENFYVPYFTGEYYLGKKHGTWEYKVINKDLEETEIWLAKAEFFKGEIVEFTVSITNQKGDILKKYNHKFYPGSKYGYGPYLQDDMYNREYYKMEGWKDAHFLFDKKGLYDGLCTFTSMQSSSDGERSVVRYTLEYRHGNLQKATKKDDKGRILHYDSSTDYELNFQIKDWPKINVPDWCVLFRNGLM